ncbi:hypothetical protein N0V82_010350 [Gnomoniopsis sp. IMI 355080]|nr:hypothetical protein N0V82_010350 [Gnomoniopsis sp. IMI 355080]
MARILTFGYNANWRGASRSISNVTDFAKELLFEMRFAKDDLGDDLNLGSRPIVFIVHSMGGLVSPKSFISDLNKSSSAIEELNEQFRHHAAKLSIWSFYETLTTSIGPKKMLVLDKDSSLLGYPAEISRPLQADHHDVCKYSSPVDSNYISVKNAIRSLVSMFRPQASQLSKNQSMLESDRALLQELSKSSVTFEEDFGSIRRDWVPETCTWVLREPEFLSWLRPSPDPKILWYSAPPANGKSTIAAFVIDHLRQSGVSCQFVFYKYSDHAKRSIANGLRALALQLTEDVPEFRTQLHRASMESLGLSSMDPKLIWRNVFEKNLAGAALIRPIYWIIDALDECESPRTFLDCLRDLGGTQIPLKIMILSRITEPISAAFDRMSRDVHVTRLEMTGREHNRQDIRIFLEQEVHHMRGSPDFKSQLIDRVLARSEGNFLWTKLVLNEISQCHTEEGIDEALEDIPDDMLHLYRRMEKSLISSARKANKPLILELFQWAICAQRPLNLTEMSQALQPRFSNFVDLRWTIKDTCGQFLQVDDVGKIEIIHHTARDYLIRSEESEFHVEPKKTHERLFRKALEVLQDDSLRWKLLQSQDDLQTTEHFVFYSAVNWSYHLGHSIHNSDEVLDLLVRFLRAPAVLAWVHSLAVLRRLEVLVKTSKVFSAFVRAIRKHNATKNPLQHRLNDLEFVDDWATDVVKIVGKFGSQLIVRPRVIYDIIPALCPGQSAMYRTFHDAAASTLRVLGTEKASWNDSLARLSLPGTSQGYKISCEGKHVAVLALGRPGATYVWDSTNFTHVCVVEHGEACLAMTLNSKGNELVTYGLKTTKIWSIPSAELLFSISNPRYMKAKAITFADGGKRLWLGGDDNVIRCISRDELDLGWKTPHPNLLNDTARVEGAIINSPMCVAFNGNNTQVGVSYRGAPLSVWSLVDGRCINRCNRAKDFQNERKRSSAAGSSPWFAVDRFTWNPITGHILGIYRDGCVFKWHPLTDENIEYPDARADEISASPDGKLFATSNSVGVVRIWSFAYFSVIYQLSSDDLVTQLAFSPDSRRFYDLRGGSVNAWGSNSLARFLEQEGHLSSDTSSEDRSITEFSKFSEERLVPYETVTAFAPNHDGSLSAVGYKDGTARLFQRGQMEGLVLAQFQHFFDVHHIKWSRDGRYIVLGDVSGGLQIKAVEQNLRTDTVQIASLPDPQIQLNNLNVQDFVFSQDSQKLLVLTQRTSFICSVTTGNLEVSRDIEDCHNRRWLPHPEQANLILGFGPIDVQVRRWTDLREQMSCPYQQLQRRPDWGSPTTSPMVVPAANHSSIVEDFDQVSLTDKTPGEILNAFYTQDGKHIVISGRQSSIAAEVIQRWTVVESAAWDAGNASGPKSPLDYYELPEHIAKQVKSVLGIMTGSLLIFLDQDLWVCACRLGSTFHGKDKHDLACQKLYFIPRDWVGQVSLERCVLTKDGTLFWPRNDGVIAIECNLDY